MFPTTASTQIYNAFKEFMRPVQDVFLIKDRVTNTSCGFAFVVYNSVSVCGLPCRFSFRSCLAMVPQV